MASRSVSLRFCASLLSIVALGACAEADDPESGVYVGDATLPSNTPDGGAYDGSSLFPDSSYSFPDSSYGDANSLGDSGSSDDGGIGSDSGLPPTSTGPCTGKPGKLRNKSRGTVMVGTTMRNFVYYAPAKLDANKPVPLVISPHGFTMSGEDMFTLTGYKEIADREGFVAVFPDGGGAAPWNVGTGISGVGPAVAASTDDQGFVDQIIKFAEADQCIDKAHMFVSGFSMGGYFSNENGCLRSDIAGIGPHSGGGHDLAGCKGSIKPVIIFHGDTDPLITYTENGVLMRDRWVKRNGCSADVDKKMVKGGTCEYHKGCPAKAQVVLCHFDGMGHAWAGGKNNALVDSSKESASELAWAFWKQYAW